MFSPCVWFFPCGCHESKPNRTNAFGRFSPLPCPGQSSPSPGVFSTPKISERVSGGSMQMLPVMITPTTPHLVAEVVGMQHKPELSCGATPDRENLQFRPGNRSGSEETLDDSAFRPGCDSAPRRHGPGTAVWGSAHDSTLGRRSCWHTAQD